MEKMDVINILIYPFFICNYKCIYCYLTNNDRSSTKVLSIKRLKIILDNFKNFKLKVEILGGEPMLKPHLIESIINLLEKYNVLSLKISTNGSLLDDYRLYLLKKFDEVQVSLDAHDKEIYMKIRGGDFDKVIKNIKTMVDNGIKVVLSFVLMRSNIKYLEKFFILGKELKVYGLSFGFFIPTGEGRKILNEVLSYKEIEDVSRKIKRLSEIYKMKVYNSLPEKIENKPYICPAGNYKFSILPNGAIVPCIYFKDIRIDSKGKLKN